MLADVDKLDRDSALWKKEEKKKYASSNFYLTVEITWLCNYAILLKSLNPDWTIHQWGKEKYQTTKFWWWTTPYNKQLNFDDEHPIANSKILITS
jgi:hypothetical protein